MSRQRHGSAGGNMASSSLMALDRIISKEAEYRSGIKQNHDMTSLIADLLAHGGEMESTMMQVAADDTTNASLQQEIQAFLLEQRERVKKLSEQHVMSHRKIDDFIESLQQIRPRVQQQSSSMSSSTALDNDTQDYEHVLLNTIQTVRDSKKSTELDFYNEVLCRDIRARLNEKERSSDKPTNTNKKRGRRKSQKDDSDDDDDDLEVLNHPAGAESLKCPVTGSLFQDPVRNMFCKHVYSMAGLQQVLKTARRGLARCPVPGCANQKLTEDQVEKDYQMEMKVRRYKRRQEAERQQRMSQAASDDDDQDATIVV